MDFFEIIKTFIGEVGYPIAVSVILFYLVCKENEHHKAEVTKLAMSLENNTAVMKENTRLMQRILEKLDAN